MNLEEEQFPEEVNLSGLPKKPRWYAVQVASGCEKRVKANLEQRIHTLDVADRILQVQIPQAATVKVRKDGSRQHGEEKVFPGYVLIKMIMDDDAWQVVKKHPPRDQLCRGRTKAPLRTRPRSRHPATLEYVRSRSHLQTSSDSRTRRQNQYGSWRSNLGSIRSI